MIITLNEIYPTDRNGEVTNFIEGSTWRVGRETYPEKIARIKKERALEEAGREAFIQREKEYQNYLNKLRNDT